MGKQVDATKPHLRKVLRREGDRELKGTETPAPRGFNTLAQAFEKAKNDNEGLRNTSIRGGRARR